jgi:hypothetical protein
MKKLLIMVCLLPMAGFGQTIIKYLSLPKLAIDSTTKLRTLRVVAPVAGAKKDKLAMVMNKWLSSNYTATNIAGATSANNATTLNGEGLFVGSIVITSPQLDPATSDKIKTNVTPVDYKVKFTIKVFVADEKYAIVINNLNLEFFNVNTPLEPFYNSNYPNILIPSENRGIDIGEMYIRMFENINRNLEDVARSASKYVAKAGKKGDL